MTGRGPPRGGRVYSTFYREPVRDTVSRRTKAASAGTNANAPPFERWGVCLLHRALAMTYFLTGNPQYHRRDVVSRSCSGWEGVGPTRYGRQEFWKKVATGAMYCTVWC